MISTDHSIILRMRKWLLSMIPVSAQRRWWGWSNMTPTTASSRAKWRLVTIPPFLLSITARCPECRGQVGGGRKGGDGAARAPPRLHPLGQAQGAARGGLLGPRLLPGDILLLQLPHLSNTNWASPSTMKTSPALSSPSRSNGPPLLHLAQAENRSHNITQCVMAWWGWWGRLVITQSERSSSSFQASASRPAHSLWIRSWGSRIGCLRHCFPM